MLRRKKINPILLVLGLAVMLATACARNDIYFEFRPVNPEAWSMDSVCTFAVEVQDTTAAYDLYLYTRNTPAYPYQNLWLFLNELSPDSTLMADTIEFYLADHRGQWLGTGMGALKEMPVLYRQAFRFPRSGTYTYTIRHGMRTDPLRGIHDIGMRVEKRE